MAFRLNRKAQWGWLVERGKYDKNEASVGGDGFVSDRCQQNAN